MNLKNGNSQIFRKFPRNSQAERRAVDTGTARRHSRALSSPPSISVPSPGAFRLGFMEQSHYRPCFSSLQEDSLPLPPLPLRFRFQDINGEDAVAGARPSIRPLVRFAPYAVSQNRPPTSLCMRFPATSREAYRFGGYAVRHRMSHADHHRLPHINQSMVLGQSHADT